MLTERITPRRFLSLNPRSPDGFTPLFELANRSGRKPKLAAEVHHDAQPSALLHTQAIPHWGGIGVDMAVFICTDLSAGSVDHCEEVRECEW